MPQRKKFWSERGDEEGVVPWTWWSYNFAGENREATKEVKDLFDDATVFSAPKPVKLIDRILALIDINDGVVLDFFSGSATTAEAVMNHNRKYSSDASFVLVQLPEMCNGNSTAGRLGYSTICDIGEERIRRAGRKIVKEIGESNQQLAFDEEPEKVPDIGFRVMRIDDSCLKDERKAPGEVDQASLDDLIDNSTEGSDSLDLLFQVLPAFRIPYSASIQERDIAGTSVYDVNEGEFLACFDENVSTDTIEAIAKEKPVYAVFRDASLADDSAAANLEELFKTFSPDTVRRVI